MSSSPSHTLTRRYTRTLVDEGDGSYNLIVLCWDTSQGSCIHSHANSHCFMKVLRGTLQETLYAWPEESSEAAGAEGLTPMSIKKAMTHNQDAVTYINGGWVLSLVNSFTIY